MFETESLRTCLRSGFVTPSAWPTAFSIPAWGDSPRPGKPNAILYTLLENCEVHGLKPEQYLYETIEAVNRLGSGATAEEIAALTPSRIAAIRKTETEAKEKAEPKAA